MYTHVLMKNPEEKLSYVSKVTAQPGSGNRGLKPRLPGLRGPSFPPSATVQTSPRLARQGRPLCFSALPTPHQPGHSLNQPLKTLGNRHTEQPSASLCTGSSCRAWGAGVMGIDRPRGVSSCCYHTQISEVLCQNSKHNPSTFLFAL